MTFELVGEVCRPRSKNEEDRGHRAHKSSSHDCKFVLPRVTSNKAFYAVLKNTQRLVKKNYNSELRITKI